MDFKPPINIHINYVPCRHADEFSSKDRQNKMTSPTNHQAARAGQQQGRYYDRTTVVPEIGNRRLVVLVVRSCVSGFRFQTSWIKIKYRPEKYLQKIKKSSSENIYLTK
jgi:hypothetical protein